MQVIASTDANGYRQSTSHPLQRLLVAVGGHKPGDGIKIGGGVSGLPPRNFWGHGATADLLCLENCSILEVGQTYQLKLGRYITHESSHSGYEGYSYDSVPYLSLRRENGIAAWQILELCSGTPGERCLELSTVNSRE